MAYSSSSLAARAEILGWVQSHLAMPCHILSCLGEGQRCGQQNYSKCHHPFLGAPQRVFCIGTVWTKLHSRIFNLNSLRQLKIIAVENKSISRPVNSPLLPISSNYLGIWHFSADTTSLWEENPSVCWDAQMDGTQQSNVNTGYLFLSQAEMSCLSCPLLLPWVWILMLPTHSGSASACNEIRQPEELPVKAFVLSSCWTNSLCDTCWAGWCPHGGLWLSLKAKSEQASRSAFLCSRMSSSWQQMEREQLLVLSSAGAAGSLLRTLHSHSSYSVDIVGIPEIKHQILSRAQPVNRIKQLKINEALSFQKTPYSYKGFFRNVWLISFGCKGQLDECYLFCPISLVFYLCCTFHHEKLKNFCIRQLPFAQFLATTTQNIRGRVMSFPCSLISEFPLEMLLIYCFSEYFLPKAIFTFKKEYTNHSIETVKLQRHLVTSSPIPSLNSCVYF